LIINFEEKRKYIPYLSELEQHSVFWPIFKSLSVWDKNEVNEIIDQYIADKIWWLKTKWGDLFRRFYEINEDNFWVFRNLNEYKENSKKSEFQEIWKDFECQLFKFEWILTDRMLKQEKWLEKVVWAFYDIIYCFFPRYGEID
jgi:hypothetical protein